MNNAVAGTLNQVLLLGLSVAATACSADEGDFVAGTGGTQSSATGGTGGQSSEIGGSATSGRMSVGGGSDGSATSTGTTSPTGPAGQCPVWPDELFFPIVGVFFYGTNPRPCLRTLSHVASSSVKVFDIEYDDAGYLAKMTSRDGSTIYDYMRERGRIVSEVDTEPPGSHYLTFQYSATSASYETSNESTWTSRYEYERDARGYPISIACTFKNAESLPQMRFVYEYVGCRLKQRIAYTDGAFDEKQTMTYEYDAEGRITMTKSGTYVETYEYSCP